MFLEVTDAEAVAVVVTVVAVAVVAVAVVTAAVVAVATVEASEPKQQKNTINSFDEKRCPSPTMSCGANCVVIEPVLPL